MKKIRNGIAIMLTVLLAFLLCSCAGNTDRAKNGAESIILRAKLVFTDSAEHSRAAAAVHPVPDSLPVLFAEYGADTYTDQVRFP